MTTSRGRQQRKMSSTTILKTICCTLLIWSLMNNDHSKMVALSFTTTTTTTLSPKTSSSVLVHLGTKPTAPTTTRRRLSTSSTSSSSSSSSPSSSSSTRQEADDHRRLQKLAQQAINNPLMSLNLNLDSLAQVGAASRAQELLQRIQALYTEGYYEVSPDVVSYNSVLKAWKEDDQPEKALQLLEAMIRDQQRKEQNDNNNNNNKETVIGSLSTDREATPSSAAAVNTSRNIQADVISFNTVMAAFAKQGNYPKAMQLLRQMQTNTWYPSPDSITYNIALYSLAQSPDRGTAAKAENLLREMMQQSSSFSSSSSSFSTLERSNGAAAVSVDTTSFNTCIYAWSREKNAYHYAERGIPKKNGHQQSNSNNNHNNNVSEALDAISTASAQRAWELLKIMEELAKAGNSNVQPDVYSYTTTIQAFARCRQPDLAQQVLQQMTRRGLQPSLLTYTALMSAFAKAGHPDRAHSILQDLMDAYQQGGGDMQEQLKPDTAAFSSIIDGWAKVASVDRPEAAKHALQLLATMKARAHEGMGPNAQTFTSVLTVLAKCRTDETCEMARNLLQEMEEDQSEDAIQRPSRIQYNAVLNAYAKSPQAEKAIKAQELMREMENHPRYDCRPDTISYNSLLEACSNAWGNRSVKDRSFEIAMAAFKTVMANAKKQPGGDNSNYNSLVSPTSTTFANFAKVCRRLLPTLDKKQSALRKTLQICCKVGMLNDVVVRQVQTACHSETEWRDTADELANFVDWTTDFRKCTEVPREWVKNSRR